LLSAGTGISQIIPVAASIFLARLYTQKDYGDLSVFMSVTGIIGAVAAFRYELTIILPKKTNDARNLLGLSVVNSFIVSLLSLIFVLIFPSFFESEFKISNTNILYLMPIVIFCTGIYNAFENWFNRKNEYKKIAVTKIVLSACSSFARILFGVLGLALGLVYGTTTGSVLAALMFLIFYLKRDKIYSLKYLSINKMGKLFHDFHDFFKYSTPSALLNSISNIGLPLLITYFYSIEYAGIYFFANNIIRQPLNLLSASISQVYKSEANSICLNAKAKLLSFTLKFQKVIFSIVFPLLLIFSIFGGQIFGFVFGNQWIESGEIIKYFAVFVLLNANYSPISSIGDILRKQKFLLFFNFSIIFSQIVLLILFSNLLDFKYMILLISLSGAVHFLYIDLYMKNSIRKLNTL
jgi:O-antigen/teichoic acid export membrane protein